MVEARKKRDGGVGEERRGEILFSSECGGRAGGEVAGRG